MGYTKIKLDNDSSKSILDDAKVYESNHPTGDSDNQIPVSFMTTPGSYIVRIFPDMFKNKVRIARHTFLHFLNFKSPSTNQDVKLRVVSDIKLQKVLEQYSETDLGNEFYKFKAKEFSLLLARVYSVPTEDKYLSKFFENNKDGYVDMILVVKPRVMREINARMSELTPSQIHEFLDIDSDTFALNVTLKEEKSNDGKYSWIGADVGVTPQKYKMSEPHFPEGVEYDGLQNAYVPEDKVITDTELAAFSLYLQRAKDRNASYVSTKSKDGFEDNYKPQQSSNEPTWTSNPSAPLNDEIPF